MVILGIDPGTRYSGYAILAPSGKSFAIVDVGCLTQSSAKPLPERILKFHDFFELLITQWGVTDLGLETPFLGKNAQNFLKLGYLRGILYMLAQKNKINILEFSPREVKCSVTGFGGASKEQVAVMVHRLFPQFTDPVRADISDALAVALCALWTQRSNASKRLF